MFTKSAQTLLYIILLILYSLGQSYQSLTFATFFSRVQYGTFDILTDEEVRQGLKEYSDWPTYPQLYVKGELIGGLDIIKELQASGELDDTLKA